MPYSSDSQRRWAHTDSAKKAGFPTDEFDQASKGKKLPEKAKKMADGGVVPADTDELYALTGHEDTNKQDEKYALTGKEGFDQGGVISYTPPKPDNAPEGDEFTNGIKDGVNHDMDAVTAYISKLFGTPTPDSTLGDDHSGLQGIANNLSQGGNGDLDKPQGFDDGGIVDPNSLNEPQTSQFNPQAGMPPAPPPTMPPPQPQMPVQAPNPVTAALGAQNAQMNKYGPEQIMQTEAAIRAQHNSPGSLAGQGLAGLGDAIMMGVGRTGNPGFLAGVQGRQEKQGEAQMGALKEAREANVQNVQEQMKLTLKDPASPMSKAAQQSYGPLLISMGATKEQVAQMPGDLIADVASKNVTMKEALARIAQEGTYQAGMLANTKASREQAEAEYEASHPINTFLANHFGNGLGAAKGAAQTAPAMPQITPDVANYAKTHGITPEQAFAIKQKRGG
jgi:hypothetical protein